MVTLRLIPLVLCWLAFDIATSAFAIEDSQIVLASTTSTENSGLLQFLLPAFQSRTGIRVHVIAIGSGQAIRLAKNGDADVLLVHHKNSEEKLVAEGHALSRHKVMYNDYIIVGPQNDPASLSNIKDATKALRRIATAQALFVSRGDYSGTHMAERKLWREAHINVDAAHSWYRETGSGMGAALNLANGMGAYTVVDRATWLAFQNKGTLTVLSSGDPKMRNQYTVLAVNPGRHPHVQAAAAKLFVKWITSPEAQKLISHYKISGEQLFYPNAPEVIE